MLLRESDFSLLTDLYELTMAAGYFVAGTHERRASFELFIRRLPENRSFLLTAGLEQLCEMIAAIRFDRRAIDYLRQLPVFAHVPGAFFDYLREFRFRGDLWAMPEGTVAFANEPIVRITGTLLEAQILETIAVNAIHFQTLIATKAARIVIAAIGRPVFEFGARRAHGPQAALLAARAALIGGCASTSDVLAAQWLGVEPVGTMAHAWVSSFPDEPAAFEQFARVFPNHTIALVDTYDVATGVRNAAKLGPRLAAIRLDSGDLAADAKAARRILDNAGCAHAKIVLSGDLNEFAIHEFLSNGVPADSFGVGTELTTSRDQPALTAVYKLVEVADANGVMHPSIKRSIGKATLGRAKQVFRQSGATGRMNSDILGLADEPIDGEPLLVPILRDGKPIATLPSFRSAADLAARQIAALPPSLRDILGRCPYPVRISPGLAAAQPANAPENDASHAEF